MYILQYLRSVRGPTREIQELFQHYKRNEKVMSTKNNHIDKMRIINERTGEIIDEYKRLQ